MIIPIRANTYNHILYAILYTIYYTIYYILCNNILDSSPRGRDLT